MDERKKKPDGKHRFFSKSTFPVGLTEWMGKKGIISRNHVGGYD